MPLHVLRQLVVRQKQCTSRDESPAPFDWFTYQEIISRTTTKKLISINCYSTLTTVFLSEDINLLLQNVLKNITLNCVRHNDVTVICVSTMTLYVAAFDALSKQRLISGRELLPTLGSARPEERLGFEVVTASVLPLKPTSEDESIHKS